MAQNSKDKNRPDKLLNHFKSIGPYKNSTNQQDEKRADNDNYRNIDPIDVALPRLDQYRQSIKSSLDNSHSRFFFITGQAGDGKTYFLRSVCTDPELFGMSDDAWRLVLDDNIVAFSVDSEGNAAGDSCVCMAPDRGVVNHITSVSLPHLSLKLNIVTDLSAIDASSPENHLLINLLEQTALMSAHECPTSEAAAGFDEVTEWFRLQLVSCDQLQDAAPVQEPRLMQQLQPPAEDSAADAVPAAAEAADKAAADGCGYKFMITLVAANKGRILRLFQTCREMDEGASLCSHFPALRDDMDNVVRNIEEHMLTDQTFQSSFMQLLSFSDLMDRSGVLRTLKAMIEHPAWDNCSSCSACDGCPVRDNRKVLQNEVVQNNLCNFFELIHDDGMKLNMRRMQILISNAIIGNCNEQSSAERCYTCNTCRNDCESERKSGTKAARRSSPFDNLLGLNLRRKDITGDYVDLFNMLRRIGPGNSGTHLINSFILSGACQDAPAGSAGQAGGTGYAGGGTAMPGSAAPGGAALSDGSVGCADGQPVQQKLLDELYARTVSCADFDVTGSFKVLRQALQQYRKESPSDEDAASTVNINKLVGALRRQLFFTMPEFGNNGTAEYAAHFRIDDFERGRLEHFADSIWDLSAIRYGRQYLTLKRQLRHSFDLTEDPAASVVRQLINGLNCAFTALPVLDSDRHVFVTANNRINPAAYSVLPHQDRYTLTFDDKHDQFHDVFKLVHSGLLGDSRGLPAMAWYSSHEQISAADSAAAASSAQVSAATRAQVRALRDDQKIEKLFQELLLKYKDKKPVRQAIPGDVLSAPVELQLAALMDQLERLESADDLTDNSEDFYRYMKEVSSQPETAEESGQQDEWVGYPEVAIKNGRAPVPAASMILTPSLFSYLMSLGAGMSAVSFTQECSDSINTFKDHIDHRIRAAYRNKVQTSGTELRHDSNLTTLRFCVINDQGKLTSSS